MPKLESYIENEVRFRLLLWAKEHGRQLEVIKLKAAGSKGLPDRLLLWDGGGVLFVEFKQPGKKPTKYQLHIHDTLRRLGFEVQVHDNITIAVEQITDKIYTSHGAVAGHRLDLPEFVRTAIPPSRKRKDRDGT